MAATSRTTESRLAAAASGLLAQPRLWETLQLPPADVDLATEQPWTAYWAARRDGHLAPAIARDVYAAAQARFADQRDRLGEWLAIAALIETFYIDEGPLLPMDAWIERLQAVLPDDGTWPSPEAEAQVMACGLAITLRDPTRPLLARWAERGGVLLRQLAPGAVRVKLATFLLQYHLWRGEFARTSLIVDALPGLDPAGVLPAEALVWHESVATHARFTGQIPRGRREIDAALALAARHGLDGHAYALHAHAASLAIAGADAAAAQAHLEAMRPALALQPQEDQTHYWHFLAGLSLLRGEAAGAVESARMALANSLEIGGPYRTAAHRLSLGQALLEQGDVAGALAELDAALASARTIDAALLVHSIQLMRADALVEADRPQDGLHAARDAFAIGARHDFRASAGWWLPRRVARVAARAMAAGIEPAFVARLVRERRLPCPDPQRADWPWRLVVRGFGGLQIEIDGTPWQPPGTGKVAQRPLELLAALVAQAAEPLSVAQALSWLWPEADDAGAQRKAFDAAVRRLRQLLGDEHLLRLEGGLLMLDTTVAWIDAAALAALVHDAGDARRADVETLSVWAAALYGLMRGPFLAGLDTAWAAAARQRQRQRLALAVGAIGDALAPHDPIAATHLLERALDLDPADESLARRAMSFHAGRGDLGRAERVLALCAAMVELQTGLPVAPATRALADELGLRAPASNRPIDSPTFEGRRSSRG